MASAAQGGRSRRWLSTAAATSPSLRLLCWLACHEVPFRLFDLDASPERPLEVLVLVEALEGDVDRALELVGVASMKQANTPRFAASLMNAGSGACRIEMSGHEASRTISERIASAYSELEPSPTTASLGCSLAVTGQPL